ncbi:MAG: type II toxin-antitoxin system RelE/ParE family toxin [Kiritimatiellia bacterium]
MTRLLFIRPEAEAEMAEAFDWYEARVPGLGSDFLSCLDVIFHSLAQTPQQYPLVHRTVRRALTHRFPYEVFFVIEDGRIVVLSVFHASRNPKSWQTRI